MSFPENIKSLILDMDGVLWRAEEPIGDLAKIFTRIRARGLKFVFATNNGSRTPEQYVDRLAYFGVEIEKWQVITSSLALANKMSQQLPANTPIYVIGEAGLKTALIETGFQVLGVDGAEQAQAVAFGIDRQITFQKMVEASLLLGKGVPFYATNLDKTYPTPRGDIPGAGAWLSVLITASGRIPYIAGKPIPDMLELARLNMGTEKAETLVIGDRLETDIAGGQASGMPVAIVLSGVSNLAEAKAWQPPVDLIVKDLTELVA